jgi:hypothetical protein
MSNFNDFNSFSIYDSKLVFLTYIFYLVEAVRQLKIHIILKFGIYEINLTCIYLIFVSNFNDFDSFSICNSKSALLIYLF